MRICELREKQVINTCNCRILGFVQDLEFDLNSGQIKSIVVPGAGRLFGIIGNDCEYVIPYDCICGIGSDVILVNVNEEKVILKL